MNWLGRENPSRSLSHLSSASGYLSIVDTWAVVPAPAAPPRATGANQVCGPRQLNPEPLTCYPHHLPPHDHHHPHRCRRWTDDAWKYPRTPQPPRDIPPDRVPNLLPSFLVPPPARLPFHPVTTCFGSSISAVSLLSYSPDAVPNSRLRPNPEPKPARAVAFLFPSPTTPPWPLPS